MLELHTADTVSSLSPAHSPTDSSNVLEFHRIAVRFGSILSALARPYSPRLVAREICTCSHSAVPDLSAVCFADRLFIHHLLEVVSIMKVGWHALR